MFVSPLGRARQTAAPFVRLLREESNNRQMHHALDDNNMETIESVEDWLTEFNWRVARVDLFSEVSEFETPASNSRIIPCTNNQDGEIKTTKNTESDINSKRDVDDDVEKISLSKAGSMAIWDVPALLMRDPVTSEDAQWQLEFLCPSKQSQHATRFDDFRHRHQSFTEAIDQFFHSKIGLERSGRTTYTISNDQLFNPGEQLFLFCHNGSGLALIAHLLGIPLAMMYTSFYLQPSSFTTIVFEERASNVYAPRAIAVGETSHFERERENVLKTVNNKYEKCTSATPHYPRPSGIKANFW